MMIDKQKITQSYTAHGSAENFQKVPTRFVARKCLSLQVLSRMLSRLLDTNWQSSVATRDLCGSLQSIHLGPYILKHA